MSWEQSGFSNFLERPLPGAPSSQKPVLSTEEFDTLVEGVSGSKITSGISRSKDGSIIIDWDKGLIELREAQTIKLVRIGTFEDGTKGIRITPAEGNEFKYEVLEFAVPADLVQAGKPNSAKLFIDNKGSGGKNRLLVQFTTGSSIVLANQT